MHNSYMQITAQDRDFKLDPRTKIFMMLMINVSAFTIDAWYVLALSAAVPLSLLLFSKRYASVLICAPLYAAALLADAYLVDAAAGAVNIVAVMLSGVISRMMPPLLLGYYLLSTTTVSEFVAAMERMHIPKQIIIPFSVMFRFFPTIQEDSSSIKGRRQVDYCLGLKSIRDF